MRSKPLFHKFIVWIFGVLAGLSPVALAEASSPQEQVQVHASRATSSLMLLRGEGFQKNHQERLETDLQALDAALQSLSNPSGELSTRHQELVTLLRQGVSFGPNEDDVPWSYTQALSKGLREFLQAAREQPQNDGSELAAKVEYLAVQYLSRSYVGTFEIARELPDTYLGQDERLLVPSVDEELAALDEKANPDVAKLKVRWEYLKAALSDMNSKSNTLESVSGRPFAPITVDRHSRALTSQWMRMN